ncbi:hypothetical protein D3C87_1898690 [compost metagenome]
MYDLRKYFFTYTTLSHNENTQIGIGYLGRYLQCIIQCGIITYNAKSVLNRL